MVSNCISAHNETDQLMKQVAYNSINSTSWWTEKEDS